MLRYGLVGSVFAALFLSASAQESQTPAQCSLVSHSSGVLEPLEGTPHTYRIRFDAELDGKNAEITGVESDSKESKESKDSEASEASEAKESEAKAASEGQSEGEVKKPELEWVDVHYAIGQSGAPQSFRMMPLSPVSFEHAPTAGIQVEADQPISVSFTYSTTDGVTCDTETQFFLNGQPVDDPVSIIGGDASTSATGQSESPDTLAETSDPSSVSDPVTDAASPTSPELGLTQEVQVGSVQTQQYDPVTGEPLPAVDPLTGEPVAAPIAQQVDPLTGEPLAASTTPQVDPLTGEPLAAPITQQVDPLTGEPLAASTTQQVDPLTGEPVSAPITQQVDPLTGEPLAASTAQQVDPLTGEPLAATSIQVDPLTGEPIAVDPALSASAMAWSPEQVPYTQQSYEQEAFAGTASGTALGVEAALDPSQQQAFDPSQQQAFDPSQQQAFDPSQQQAFDPSQQQAFDPSQQQAFDPSQQQAFDPSQQQAFDPSQQQAFDPSQQQAFDPSQQQAFDPSQQQAFDLSQQQFDPSAQTIQQQAFDPSTQPMYGQELESESDSESDVESVDLGSTTGAATESELDALEQQQVQLQSLQHAYVSQGLAQLQPLMMQSPQFMQAQDTSATLVRPGVDLESQQALWQRQGYEVEGTEEIPLETYLSLHPGLDQYLPPDVLAQQAEQFAGLYELQQQLAMAGLVSVDDLVQAPLYDQTQGQSVTSRSDL